MPASPMAADHELQRRKVRLQPEEVSCDEAQPTKELTKPSPRGPTLRAGGNPINLTVAYLLGKLGNLLRRLPPVPS